MMEGISHEPARWPAPGVWQANGFLDDNGISIDGHIEGWYTDDTAKRSKPTAGMWFLM